MFDQNYCHLIWKNCSEPTIAKIKPNLSATTKGISVVENNHGIDCLSSASFVRLKQSSSICSYVMSKSGDRRYMYKNTDYGCSNNSLSIYKNILAEVFTLRVLILEYTSLHPIPISRSLKASKHSCSLPSAYYSGKHDWEDIDLCDNKRKIRKKCLKIDWDTSASIEQEQRPVSAKK
jgi:hypothetical protein